MIDGRGSEWLSFPTPHQNVDHNIIPIILEPGKFGKKLFQTFLKDQFSIFES